MRLNVFTSDTGFIRIKSSNLDSTINSCYFYGCNSIDSHGVFCSQGNQFSFTKSNFFNSYCNKYTISMEHEANLLDYISYTKSKLSSSIISNSVLQGISNFTVKNLNTSNCLTKKSQLLYENFNYFSISYLLLNNCQSLYTLTLGQKDKEYTNSFFKYISITNSKAKYCFLCNNTITSFENIYMKNLTCQDNVYFYTEYSIIIDNCYSDHHFEISGDNKIQNVKYDYSDTIPISGYYEEAILNFLPKTPYKSKQKDFSKSIIIKELEGDFTLDRVIFQNITSSEYNGTGGAISICCFSSNIDIKNCKFEVCRSMMSIIMSINLLCHFGHFINCGYNV